LVFDFDPSKVRTDIVEKVEAFLAEKHGKLTASIFDGKHGSIKHGSCKAVWDDLNDSIKIVEFLPRRHPLRIGSAGFLTQGKACNQLNALRFASGHILQALDANMGVFVGEAFKMPFAMRRFLPLGVQSRTVVQSRYIGFREDIFTRDDGVVGRCLASAEWTFGTIYQRFLSGLGARMHYGHPDFLDAFWASNRGGMSKSSAIINLSEDIFAGYNCKMRDERCPHIDFLEFQKGREASLNSASNFFFKIAGGSVGMMRSRDLQLICDNVGVIHCMSFYFSSVAFYISNLLVDLTIYLYVILFISFTLASESLSGTANLGTALSSEWIVALGILCIVPQFFELILEHGAGTALIRLLPEIINSSLFFMFQNKTVSSAVKQGSVTGKAKYFFTGRPLANQHFSWRDSYLMYCQSHYYPAFLLILLFLMYHLLSGLNGLTGTLPMVYPVLSSIIWIIAPVLFTPFPNMGLLKQDLKIFWDFIMAPVRADAAWETEGTNEMKAAKAEDSRSLLEWTFARELHDARVATWQTQLLYAVMASLTSLVLLLVIPANILDYLVVFLSVFGVRWLLVVLSLARGANNLLVFFTFAVWIIVPFVSDDIIGNRGGGNEMIEYIICFVVFVALMNTVRRWMNFIGCLLRIKQGDFAKHDMMVHMGYHLFFKADLDTGAALVVLVTSLFTSLLLMVVECPCGSPRGLHTWWLLNSNVAKTAVKSQEYVPKAGSLPGLHKQSSRDHSGLGKSGLFGRSFRAGSGQPSSMRATS